MNLQTAIDGGDPSVIAQYMKEHNLKLNNDTIVAVDQSHAVGQFTFWDKRQLVKKINLNS